MAAPEISIRRIAEDYRLFEVYVDGELENDWATADEALAIAERELGGYRIQEG